MALVRNVQMSVGRAPSGKEFAELDCDIEFSFDEQRLGLTFSLWAILYERDGALDVYVKQADASSSNHWRIAFNGDALDQNIGTIATDVIQAGGANPLHRNYRREWDFPPNEAGPEEYRALVLITPNIKESAAWSNEVSIDLK